jgi:uncharacterized OB-fold protein
MSERKSREERITPEPNDLPEIQLSKRMNRASQGNCPDCGAETYPVKLVCAPESTWANPPDSVVRYYATKSAKRGWLKGKFPVKGRVAAEMCQSCGRITLYGIPNQPKD